MKFTIAKEVFLKLLRDVSRIAKDKKEPTASSSFTKVTLDALSSEISLTVIGDGCNITKLEPAMCNEEGSFLLHIKKATEWLTLVGAGELEVAASKSAIVLTVGKESVTLRSMPVEEFPNIVSVVGKKIASADFRDIMVAEDSSAGSKRAVGRPDLDGVYIEPNGERLLAMASDGIRFSTVSFDGTHSLFEKLMIPSSACEIVSRIGPCTMFESASAIKFQNDNTTLIVQKSEHRCPEWRAALLKWSFDSKVFVEREEFGKELRKCHCLRSSEDNYAKIKIGIGKNSLTLCAGSEGEESISTINCKSEGPERIVILRTDHMLSFLSKSKDDTIELAIDSNQASGRLTCGNYVSYFCGFRG